jgi:hypothetical protein
MVINVIVFLEIINFFSRLLDISVLPKHLIIVFAIIKLGKYGHQGDRDPGDHYT